MSRSPVLLIYALLLALVSPAAILAQDPRVEFSIAVVALDGSFETADDGEGCQLVWPNAGTPTLRVASSSGDRFRQDLLDGEQVTVPDVDEEPSCLFMVDISVTGGRSFAISIEGSELTQVSDDDIEDLSATMVLPVEADRDGDIVLATDDYLDIDLSQQAGTEEDVATTGESDGDAGGSTVPGVLRKVPVEPIEQSATPEIPVATIEPSGATPMADDAIAVEVHLLVHDDAMIRMTAGCRIALRDEQAVLTADAEEGARAEMSLTRQGRIVSADTSPTGEPGCLFRATLELTPASEYTFRIGETELATVPFEDLASRDEPLLLQIASDGNRTTGLETSEEATPEPVVQGGDIGDGQFLIAGQLDFRSENAVTTDLGCMGGPGNGDIAPGVQLVIRNEVGAIIGYGDLEDTSRSGDGGCSYSFTVVVPASEFYVVELGDRGNVVYSHLELESTGWRMVLETGEK